MESPPPPGDPEEGNRPIGALAMVTAAVRHFSSIVQNSSNLRVRLSVLLGCTPPVITSMRLKASMQSSGVRTLRSSWSTSPRISLKGTGMVFSGGSPPCRNESTRRPLLRQEPPGFQRSVFPFLPQIPPRPLLRTNGCGDDLIYPMIPNCSVTRFTISFHVSLVAYVSRNSQLVTTNFEASINILYFYSN